MSVPVSPAASAAVRPRSRSGLACLVASGLLWGTSGLIGTLLGRTAGLSPLAVAAIRLLAGGGLIVAFLTVTGGAFPSGRAAWRRVAVNGLLSALFQGCYFAAISLTSVSLATLVTIGAAPVVVAAVERIRDGRVLGRQGLITLGLALAGLALLVWHPGGGPGGPGGVAVLTGSGLALLSAASFAAITLIGTSPVPGLTDLTVNGYGFTLGGLVLLPLTVFDGGLGFGAGLSPAKLAAAAGLLLALAVGPTAVAYTLYYRGLRTESAATAALLTLLEPLAAAVLGATFLGDRLGVTGVAGALILGAALVRAIRGRRK
jgi:drug/metabolite transporter, DME family